MTQIIAGIYEIEEEIGAGGGGIVYRGHHTRLNKEVVLKADKRKLSAGTETLRREVDMLKGLSHTYIPQVYDFVQEGGSVYTVMDYIEGVSLDKILAAHENIQQKKIIKWACQLLEALSYLHSQKPHGILHGDIKPANIMLRNNGDICLIDYNIALALGEDGAVKVGFSRGYASPEHYGSDYTNFNIRTADTVEKTEVDDPEKTIVDQSESVSVKKTVMLDVRSDIYSLGATLYHLISGRKPEQSALEVTKLTSQNCSEAVAGIINKAMNPNPNQRYQSATEMLEAFLQLRAKDQRVTKGRKLLVSSMMISGIVFLFGCGMTFVGVKQMENHQKDLTLASYSGASLAEGDVQQAVYYAMQAAEKSNSILEAPVTAEATAALADALGAYDLSDGFKAYKIVELPTVPFDICISPDKTRYAVIYEYQVAIYGIEDTEPITALPIQKSALSDCVFVDEDTIIFAGQNGLEEYSISEEKTLWTGELATNIAVSGDRKVVAAVDRDSTVAQIYRVNDGKKIAECDFEKKHLPITGNDIFADPKNYIFELDQDGKQLAVSFSDGGLNVFNIANPDESLIVYEKSDYSKFSGGFSGRIFAFGTGNESSNFLGMIDTETAEYIGTLESGNSFLVQTDENGIYLANGTILEKIDPNTLEERALAHTTDQSINSFDVSEKYSVVATDNQRIIFYDAGANQNSVFGNNILTDFVCLTEQYAIFGNRNENVIRIMKLEDHKEAEWISYDPSYGHDEARVSQDRNTLMLFDYQGFEVYDRNGGFLVQTKLPDADQIYDQQYRRNEKGSYLEVTWYDGTVRTYGEDGQMILEEKRDPPAKDLQEEFFTQKYRIESSLHDKPIVYKRENNKFIMEMEEDAYLTYVTELDDYVVMQFVRTSGEKYGVLYDKELHQLAQLPNLCDVYRNTLVFDYPSGNIRTCKIYQLDELLAVGNDYMKQNVTGEVR